MTKLLFFDIDGVCNAHNYDHVAESTTFERAQVRRFNRVINETDCRLVVVSAWRYLILRGAMTLAGFECLLRSHGVYAKGRLVGKTGFAKDEMDEDRGELVKEFLRDYPAKVGSWAVVDDLDLGYSHRNMPFVKPDEKVGLTDEDADRLIELLNEKPARKKSCTICLFGFACPDHLDKPIRLS